MISGTSNLVTALTIHIFVAGKIRFTPWQFQRFFANPEKFGEIWSKHSGSAGGTENF
jgi:hypothetical protein